MGLIRLLARLAARDEIAALGADEGERCVTKGIDTMPPSRLLSLPEVADRLGYSIRTIRRRIATGDLAFIRDGGLIRVRPEDLERYIQQRRFGDHARPQVGHQVTDFAAVVLRHRSASRGGRAV